MHKDSLWQLSLPGRASVKIHLVHPYVIEAYGGVNHRQRYVCHVADGALRHSYPRLRPLDWEEVRPYLDLLSLGTQDAAVLASELILAKLLTRVSVKHDNLLKWVQSESARRVGWDDAAAAVEDLAHSGSIVIAEERIRLSDGMRKTLSAVPAAEPQPGEWQAQDEHTILVHTVERIYHKGTYVRYEDRDHKGVQRMPLELFLCPVRHRGQYAPRFMPVTQSIGSSST